jgi:FkbM family methyltransferase
MIRVAGFRVQILDPTSAYVMFKDIFENEIYRFHAQTQEPRVLDCGSNIGMSILYFKYRFPEARIVGFEADREVFDTLTRNVAGNGLRNVELVEAAVSSADGQEAFARGRDYDGSLIGYQQGEASPDDTHQVRTVSLRHWLAEPVDFLKLNIEGAEYQVLSDIAELLPNVAELVVEYHHEPGLPRTLDRILALLDEAGFEYLIHDFDRRTNVGSHPPFELSASSRYYLLIYATQIKV